MSAKSFFTMLKASYDLETEKKAAQYLELCDIQAISICDGKYQSELRNLYFKRAFPDYRPPTPKFSESKKQFDSLVKGIRR